MAGLMGIGLKKLNYSCLRISIPTRYARFDHVYIAYLVSLAPSPRRGRPTISLHLDGRFPYDFNSLHVFP